MTGQRAYPTTAWLILPALVPAILIVLGFLLVVAYADALEFDRPAYAWFAAAGPLAGVVIMWGFDRRRRAMARFAASDLAPRLAEGVSPGRQVFRAVLVSVGVLMISAALIGPRWGVYIEQHKVYGVDIVVALDVSRSMLAEDVEPNRLERAKREIRQQLTERNVFGRTNRLGLIAFAGSTSLKTPLSTDLMTFRQRLDSVDVGSAPRGGTAIARAIRAATDLFVRSPEDATKIILVFTDGEDHEGDAISAAQMARVDHGITTYVIGVGDPSEPSGATIPVDVAGRRRPLLHEGQIVFSKLNVDSMQKTALAGDGQFALVTDFNRLVDAIAGKHKVELSAEERVRHRPRYQWFLALALLCLAVETATRERDPKPAVGHLRIWQQEAAA